jgi:hypothetical protein
LYPENNHLHSNRTHSSLTLFSIFFINSGKPGIKVTLIRLAGGRYFGKLSTPIKALLLFSGTSAKAVNTGQGVNDL